MLPDKETGTFEITVHSPTEGVMPHESSSRTPTSRYPNPQLYLYTRTPDTQFYYEKTCYWKSLHLIHKVRESKPHGS